MARRLLKHPGVSGPQMAGNGNRPKPNEVCDGSSRVDPVRGDVRWWRWWQGWLV